LDGHNKLGDLQSINQFIYLKVKHVELVYINRFIYVCVFIYIWPKVDKPLD